MCWLFLPKIGVWFTLLAILPWFLRVAAGSTPFHRTPLDWLMAIFLVTALIGYWAAYDKTTAWIKFWLIVTAILLYYALSAQIKQNLVTVSLLSFCLGLGVAAHFFLTYNFTGVPATILSWWINKRHEVGWQPIHHGYTSGLLLITNLFALHWLVWLKQRISGPFTVILKLLSVVGLVVMLLAFVLTMSRGIWAAIGCAVGIWVIWRILKGFGTGSNFRLFFPSLVLPYLVVTIVLLYLMTAQTGLGQGAYGENTRAEVFTRSTHLLLDYIFTGGGLGSFAGLYSQYILTIPYFYFINSYNIFLDVAVEQGLIGGLAFVSICLGSTWLVCQRIAKAHVDERRFASWVSLFALVVVIVHGSIYDYLYNGSSTLLMFFPMGMAMGGVANPVPGTEIAGKSPTPLLRFGSANLLIVFLGILVLLMLNFNKVVSLWYSNLGAVQMSQVELRNFPTSEWADSQIVPQLEIADTSFRSAIQYYPYNQTANYRLGLISMLRQDFRSAVINLEIAYQGSPEHRGIIKNLGYCYVWLGDMDKASELLRMIPEAQTELDAYTWWWNTQGRQDLSKNATQFSSFSESSNYQP
jgi:hypothetical protein